MRSTYHWLVRCAAAVIFAALLASTPAASEAQQRSVAELIEAGDRESANRRPQAAAAQYEAAIARDSNSFDANWKASRELVDLGEAERDERARSAMYDRALAYARRAAAMSPNSADAQFHLSRALGRKALSVGIRDRVRLAGEVRERAMRALELDPRHPGAAHVLGVWNAEVMRLNSVARAMARTFLGGQVMAQASWQEAARLLELSVAVEPNRTVHHLDLARIYRDMGRKADARLEYERAIKSPLHDANDDMYKKAATDELRALR